MPAVKPLGYNSSSMVHVVNSQNRPDMPVGKESKGGQHVVPPNGVMGKGSVLKHRGGG